MTLMLGDCLEIMPEIPDGSVDLVIADLPYGTTACKWDKVIPMEPLWAQFRRILKPTGVVVLTASQPFTSMLVMSNPEWFKYCWVWVKSKATGFMHAKNAPMKLHEDVVVFSPASANHASMSMRRMTYHPQFSHGEPYRKVQLSKNIKDGVSHRASRCNWDYVGTVSHSDGKRYPVSILKFSTSGFGNVHPTQKPIPLFEYLIRTYTSPGDLVLDPTMDSGTTGVACVNTGREFIGIERDPTYFKSAKARIRTATLPEVI